MNYMLIDYMKETDIKSVALISEDCFKDLYKFDWLENAESLYKLSDLKKVTVLIAREEELVLGFCNLRTWPAGGWIDLIGVATKFRNKGIGRKLLKEVENEAVKKGIWKISLIVSEKEDKTIAFYTNNGFELVGEMRDEIKIGINGILMSKILDYKLHPNQ